MEECRVCGQEPLAIGGVALNVKDTMQIACDLERTAAEYAGRGGRRRRGAQRGGAFQDDVAKICGLNDIYNDALASVPPGAQQSAFTRSTAALVQEYNKQIGGVAEAVRAMETIKDALEEGASGQGMPDIDRLAAGVAGEATSEIGGESVIVTAGSSAKRVKRGGAPPTDVQRAVEAARDQLQAGDLLASSARATAAAAQLEATAAVIRTAAAAANISGLSAAGVAAVPSAAGGGCTLFQKAFALAALTGGVAAIKMVGMAYGSYEVIGLLREASSLLSSTFKGVIAGLTAAIQTRNTAIVTAMSTQYQAISTAFTTDTILGKLAGKGPLIKGAIVDVAGKLCSRMPLNAGIVKEWGMGMARRAHALAVGRPGVAAAAAAEPADAMDEAPPAAAAADAAPAPQLPPGQQHIPVQGAAADGAAHGVGGRRRRGRKSRKHRRSRSSKSRKGGKRSGSKRSRSKRSRSKRSRSNKSRKGGKRSRSKRSRTRRTRQSKK